MPNTTNLFVSRKDDQTRDGLEIVSRQIELWTKNVQKVPFTGFQTGWTASTSGWSIDPFGYIHMHGQFTYSGAAITGNQNVCTIGPAAVPNSALSATISGAAAAQIPLGNPFFVMWIVSSPSGVVSINFGSTSATAYVVYLTGILYHPVLL